MITPNRLTYFRIVLAFLCPILVLSARNAVSDVLVMFLFTAACVTDWWDGHLARKYSLITKIGKILDPIADKMLILGLMLSFVSLGLYSFAWIFFILVREVLVTTVRLIRLLRGQVIPAEWAGKLKIGFQIGSIYSSLLLLFVLDLHFKTEIPRLVFNAIHYLGILLANVFTITSGLLFFKRLGPKP